MFDLSGNIILADNAKAKHFSLELQKAFISYGGNIPHTN